MRVQIARAMAIAVAASLSSVSLLAQDECSSATPLAIGGNGPFDSTGATASSPAWTCGGSTAALDVWYSFTPAFGGLLTIDTEGSVMSDTVLEVFDGCGGTLITCDDDSGSGNLSKVVFTANASVTYFARVKGYGGTFGVHNVNVGLVSPDECSQAIPIVAGLNGPFTNAGATTSVPAIGCSTASNSDVWFVYTASVTGQLAVTTGSAGAGSITDTVMEVWDACGGTVLDCNDDYTVTGFYSQVVLPITQGASYYIRVADYGTVVDQGLFNVDAVETPLGVQNEECTGAVALVSGANGPFDTTGSTVSSPSWPCGFTNSGDLWYSYTATVCGDLVINTQGSSLDTVLEVLTGGCGSLVSVGCNDDFAGFGLQSQVTVSGVVAGQQFRVRVAGYNVAFGSFSLNVTENVTFTNDDCAGAIPVALGMNGTFSNACATNSTPTWPCGSGANDAWFSFQANLTAPHTFRTCGGSFDTVLEVFDGACGSLVSLGCNDDSSTGPCSTPLPNRQSSVTASLTNGATYLVRVGGFLGARGTFPLEVLLGNGTGSIAMTTASLCTVPGLTLSFTGSPTIGGTVTGTMSGFTGLPFTILTLSASVAPFATCPCVTFAGPGANWLFGNTISLAIPADASFLGLPIRAQGVDLLGAPAACNEFVASAFTDIFTITIN